jgi:hypothetical protein
MLSEQENEKGLWYPDEEICRKRKNIPEWVKKQRKIAKKVKPESHAFYFTLEMLKVPFRVTGNTKGLDPDKEEPPQLRRWLKRYSQSEKKKLDVALGRKPKRKTRAQRVLELILSDDDPVSCANNRTQQDADTRRPVSHVG